MAAIYVAPIPKNVPAVRSVGGWVIPQEIEILATDISKLLDGGREIQVIVRVIPKGGSDARGSYSGTGDSAKSSAIAAAKPAAALDATRRGAARQK